MPEFPVTGPISATVRISSGTLRFVAEQRDSVVVDVRPGNSAKPPARPLRRPLSK